MSQRIASPKLTAPPPPISHARQPTRFTAKVMLFTANTHTHTQREQSSVHEEGGVIPKPYGSSDPPEPPRGTHPARVYVRDGGKCSGDRAGWTHSSKNQQA